MPKTARLLIVAGLVLPLAHQAFSQPVTPEVDRVDLQYAVERSRGLYGDAAATRIVNHSLTARYRTERWIAEVQVPWMDVRSDDAVGGLPGSVGSGTSGERGLGDVWMQLSWDLQLDGPPGLAVDLTGKLKLRTGDVNRGLGSGGVDVALQVEVMHSQGPLSTFGHLGWRRTGDVAGYTPYRDPWYGEIGLQTRLSSTIEVGAMYDAREPLGRLGPLSEATAYVAWRAGDHRLQLHLVRGFARASPDTALGLTLRTRF